MRFLKIISLTTIQKQRPIVRWRSVSTLLFTNWLNYYVYQETPYIIEQIQKMKFERDKNLGAYI